jgi:hypothetical protein
MSDLSQGQACVFVDPFSVFPDCILSSLTRPETTVGYAGGAALPLFDAFYDNGAFEFILSRHEQGAGHMAQE